MNDMFKIPCPNCGQFYCLKSLSPEPNSIPLLLKCGHTMCESCIRKIVKFGEPIECKMCHREMEIKTTDIAKLLQNEIQLYKLFPVNVNMLGELALDMISEKPHVEDNEDFFVDLQAILADTEKQLGRCLECQADTLLMCQQCATVICEECFNKSHKSFTVFKNHFLKNIEFQIMPNNCDIHKDKALDYYCKNCAKSICMDCLMVGTEKSCKSHDVVPTVEMNKTLLNDVQEISPQVDTLYRRLTKTAVDIGHLLHNIDNDSGSSELKEVTATIEQHFSALHAKIQNHKEEVMNIIARLKGIEKDSLVKAKNDVTKALVDSKQVMKSLKSALESDKKKSVNLSIILNDAKNILARPWYLTMNESSKDTLKVTVNDDLCMLISDYIQLEGNAKALYKLRATHELDGEEIPPPPSAPVLPPVLPKGVRFANAKDKKPANPKPITSESFVARPESKKALVQPVMPNAENKPLVPLREIKEGSQISARITHMVDPHHFFVQRASDEKKLIDMVKQLQENLRDIVRDVTVGGMYAVNLNGTWMRCRVDSIEPDINGQTYHVTCLDYGTPALVKIQDLRESPAAFVVGASRGRYPAPMAIRCSLANCTPANDAWTASDTRHVRNMIDDELVTLHVRRSGATVDCDVMTRDGTSVAHALSFVGRAVLIKPHLPYPEVAPVPRPKLYLSNSFNSKSCEDVHLTHVVSPDRFYLRAAYLQDDFIKLCAELNQEYNRSDTTGCIYLPENGMVCVVHITKEDRLDHVGWARAIVKSRGAGTVTVFLPDIGNTVEVNWDRLRRIKDKFTMLRGLAIECHLAGVRPRYGEWQGNSLLLLNMHKINALKLIIDKKHNRKTMGAILFSEYGNETVCVNQEMVVNMLAEATGSIDLESMNSNGKSSGSSSETESPLNKTFAKANPPTSPAPLPVPMAVPAVSRPVPVVPEIDRQELNGSPNAPIRLEAKIMHYESPSLIYFSLVHQQKTFDELFEDIQKFYMKRRTQKARMWKMNDRCCAFCIQSETWRRATILQMENNTATVFYTDFASTETVPMSHLKVLHSDFEVIGDAVVKCHLAGILPAAGDQWPTLTKEFLKENLEAYTRVFITKVGHFVDKSMPVELWVYHTVQGSALEPDKSEWRCLNKVIVKQGLAVPDPRYQAPTESIATTTSAANSEVDQGVVISLDDISFTEAVLQPPTTSTSEVVTRTFPNFDLTTLLQTTTGGNSVLKFYETFGYLDNCKRKQLTDIIIKHIYTYIVHNRITYEEYNILAAKIITVFPKETIGTYFTRPVKKCSSINGRSLMAQGKLVDKVRNLLYKYGDRKRRSSDNSENIEYPLKKACIKELHDSHSTDIIWMSCNSEPWEEVIKKWTATFEIRKECSYSNIHEIFKEFKILQDQRSDTLINIDFDLLYPEKGLNFFLNWDNFFTKITTLKPTHDERLNEIMQSLQNIEDDVKLPAQLHILGHLVPPKGRLSKKIKFTTQESIDSIFICVEIESKQTVDNEELSFLNLRGPVSDWLLKTPLRSACVISPAGFGAGCSAGDSENTMFVTDWLPAEPLKSEEFTAMPTYIDNDGVIYLHNVDQGEVLELIRDTLEIAFKEDDPKSQYCTWRVGEPCVARYYLDSSLYRGTIIEVNHEESTCLVQYVDYGNNELCAFTDLRKEIALHQIPIQAHKCVLSRIQPINGKWETVVLDYIHKAIVEKKCLVRVTGEPVDGITPINLKYGKLWINDHLVEFDMATFTDGSVPIVRMFTPVPPQKKKAIKKEVVECQVIEVDCESELDYIVDEESDVPNSNESSKLQIDATESTSNGTNEKTTETKPQILFYPKHKEEFECTVTITNNTNLLELSIISDEKTKALYKALFENVQNKGEEMPPLEGIFENQACVALYPEDNKWYRALVLSYSAVKELVKVRYVDYGNNGIIALSHTRAISEDWVKLPPLSMKVNLDGSDTVEVADLLKGPIHAKMVQNKDSTCIELRNSQGELAYRTCL